MAKMKPRGFIIIAIALALVTALLVFLFFKGMEKKPDKDAALVTPKTPVVFTVRDVPAKTILNKMMITIKELESELVPEGAIQSFDAADGSVTKTDLSANSPIFYNQLYPGVRLSYLVPEGKRAVSLMLETPAERVANLIRPGDVVDIIGTFEEEFVKEEITKIIVQASEILAIGGQLPGQPAPVIQEGEKQQEPGPMPITLAVTPQEAEKLVIAAKKSLELRLALRSPEQKEYVWTIGVTAPRLFGLAIANKTKEIEVLSGVEKRKEEVEYEYK